jgi:hypothetical protein
MTEKHQSLKQIESTAHSAQKQTLPDMTNFIPASKRERSNLIISQNFAATSVPTGDRAKVML